MQPGAAASLAHRRSLVEVGATDEEVLIAADDQNGSLQLLVSVALRGGGTQEEAAAAASVAQREQWSEGPEELHSDYCSDLLPAVVDVVDPPLAVQVNLASKAALVAAPERKVWNVFRLMAAAVPHRPTQPQKSMSGHQKPDIHITALAVCENTALRRHCFVFSDTWR